MLELPDTKNVSDIADWVELSLSLGEDSFSKSKISSLIRDEEDASDEFTSNVWRTLKERLDLYSNKFFEVNGDLVQRNDAITSGRLVYQTCLLFSLYGGSSPGEEGGAVPGGPKLFERMSAEAVSNYIQGKVFVFGWPVLNDVEKDIGNRVKQVAQLMNERFVESPSEKYKDRGVDVIAWKNFKPGDNSRSSQLVMLAQCATGRNWGIKTGQLPRLAWRKYIHWTSPPCEGFIVPCVVEERSWQNTADDAHGGIIFDRVRLVNLLPNDVEEVLLKNELEEWFSEQIGEFFKSGKAAAAKAVAKKNPKKKVARAKRAIASSKRVSPKRVKKGKR